MWWEKTCRSCWRRSKERLGRFLGGAGVDGGVCERPVLRRSRRRRRVTATGRGVDLIVAAGDAGIVGGGRPARVAAEREGGINGF